MKDKFYYSSKVKNNTRATQGKRALASPEGVLIDLKKDSVNLYNAFYRAVDESKELIKNIPLDCRIGRGEAQLFQMCLAKHLKSLFPNLFRIGKHGRLIMDFPDYILLFKKLNNKGLPMNIKTGTTEAISNQLSLNLFDDECYEPILFFGYEVSRLGNLINPRIVYIDEGRIQFTISEEQFKNTKSNINLETNKVSNNKVSPSLKNNDNQKELSK